MGGAGSLRPVGFFDAGALERNDVPEPNADQRSAEGRFAELGVDPKELSIRLRITLEGVQLELGLGDVDLESRARKSENRTGNQGHGQIAEVDGVGTFVASVSSVCTSSEGISTTKACGVIAASSGAGAPR